MDCGYGYQKGSDGGCSAMSWVCLDTHISQIVLIKTIILLSIPKAERKDATKPRSSTMAEVTDMVDTVVDLVTLRLLPKLSIRLSPR